MSDPEPPGPGAGSLGKRATRASVITLGSFIGAQLLRLAGNLVLTRLLFEEAFGLMALVYVFLTGLQLFSDVGIGPSIIQSERGEDPAFQDTAFTIQVGRGVVLWLLACAGAAPFALLYDTDALRKLVPVAALAPLIAGFNSTKLFTHNRRLSMARPAIVELASQATALATMIVYAHFQRSVWALVSGALALNATSMVLSHLLLPGRRNRLRWDPVSARELLKFGRWIFLSTALSFLAAQSDRMIFGKLISLRELGIYNIALMMASMPLTALGRLSNAVLFPVFSRSFSGAGADVVDRAFRRVRRPVLLVGGLLISSLIAAGPVLIELLYDERFHQAGWMLQLLAVGSWFGFLEYTVMAGLLAAGRTNWIASGAAARLAAIAVLIPLGFSLGGFPGALVGYACSDLARLAVSVAGARRLGIRNWSLDALMTAVVAIAALAGHGAGRQVALHVSPGPLNLLAQGAAIAATIALFWLPFALPYIASGRVRPAALSDAG